MAFISLAGAPRRVVDGSMTYRLEYQGGREIMAAGNMISTEANPRRILDFKVRFTTVAEEAAVRAFYPRGVAGQLEDGQGGFFNGFIEFGVGEAVRTLDTDGTIIAHSRVPVHIEEVL